MWSSDGSQLFFRRSSAAAPEPAISTVSISTEPSVTWSAQETLPIRNFSVSASERSFDMLPDGRLVIALPAGNADSAEAIPPQVNIVVNWFDELERRVPTP